MAIREGEISAEDRVYLRLREAIIRRRLSPGMQLGEAAIATELGISRTPVRVALRRLAHEGLVNTVPHKGSFVARPSAEGASHLYQVRAEIEGLSARLASERMEGADIDYLRKLNCRQEDCCLRKDVDGLIEVNDEIHRAIAESSQNPILLKYVMELSRQSNIYIIFLDSFFSSPVPVEPRSVREHNAVFACLERRDGDGAARAMRAHLLSTLAHLDLHLLEVFPGSARPPCSLGLEGP